MNKVLIAITIIFWGTSISGLCQESESRPLEFELDRVYPAIWVTQHTLDTAQTLVDLNPHFKPSWVRQYLNVEIITYHNGKMIRSTGKNNQLTSQQVSNLKKVDPGSTVEVKVRYIPENNLKNNEPKDWDFTFIIDPEQSAEFPGGKDQLVQYLKNHVIDRLNNEQYQGFDLNTIKFTVNGEGQVIDAHIFWPSNHEDIDSFLLESICDMPLWKPAEYKNGLKVPQEFYFAVGNMDNCVMNLLDIKRMLK